MICSGERDLRVEMWNLNSLCFLNLSTDCDDLQGWKVLLYVRAVRRNDCSAFLCVTALVKQCLLGPLGTGRVMAHVKEHLCSETAKAGVSCWARRRRLVCWKDPLSYLFAQNKLLKSIEKWMMCFPVRYKRTYSLRFLSFRNCCVSESVEQQLEDQTLKGVLLSSDVFWRNKMQITSVGWIFPWFPSPGVVLWPEAALHCILLHIVSFEKLEKYLLAWWIVCLGIKLQAAPDSSCADFLQVSPCSVLIQFSEILLAWQATLAHAHAESLAKSHLLKLPSFIGQFVKYW